MKQHLNRGSTLTNRLKVAYLSRISVPDNSVLDSHYLMNGGIRHGLFEVHLYALPLLSPLLDLMSGNEVISLSDLVDLFPMFREILMLSLFEELLDYLRLSLLMIISNELEPNILPNTTHLDIDKSESLRAIIFYFR